jgi:hypothetical protein
MKGEVGIAMVLCVGGQVSKGIEAKPYLCSSRTHMKDGTSAAPPPDEHQASLPHLLDVELFPVVLIPSDDNAWVIAVDETNGRIVRFSSQEMLFEGQVEERGEGSRDVCLSIWKRADRSRKRWSAAIPWRVA